MTEDPQSRYLREQEKLRTQEAIARDRMRTQVSLAQERSERSVALQSQRFDHQRGLEQEKLTARTDVARITGQFDLDLARLQHEQLPGRLAIESEFEAIHSEMVRDELQHEVGIRALFSVVEFAAKSEITGTYDAERDERQFSHDIELEKLRQQGVSNVSNTSSKPPTKAELEAWLERVAQGQKY